MQNTFTVTCNRCHKDTQLTVDTRDMQEWQQGKFIQDAMPYLSADERELLISQTCGKCFDELFPAED